MIKAVIFDMYETLITQYESPLYFSSQMAVDAGIPENQFQAMWRAMETERTIGNITLEKAIEIILKKNGCYAKELLDTIVHKRIECKKECFHHLHTEIIPLLCSLKNKGIRIGLISNCFSEEAKVIRNSVLFPYFDAVCLSYEEGIQKPNTEIYKRCINRLRVKACECLYVGDGGSQELEAANGLGIKAVQAVWYFKAGTTQHCGRKAAFTQIETPLDIRKTSYKKSS